MLESLISEYNKLSFRQEEVIIQNFEGVLQFLCAQTAVTCISSGCSFRVHRKVETLVPSAMIDTQSLQSNYRDTFSQYILLLLLTAYSALTRLFSTNYILWYKRQYTCPQTLPSFLATSPCACQVKESVNFKLTFFLSKFILLWVFSFNNENNT